ncbi:MAG: HisA/HisF family protein [Methanobacteriaceae archaeon]|nr:HisA/HisF family protein [Methanobacteriaceae archaeon]
MIIPVLDLKDGIAVSGKAGKRDTYQPLQTVFNENPDPMKIAEALKNKGATRIYIADLDSIERVGDNSWLIKEINKILPVMLDCGASKIIEVQEALKIADFVIVATETLKELKDLDKIFQNFLKNRIIVSIDLLDGKIYSKYLKIDLEILMKKLDKIRPEEIILLDISRVGSERGFDSELINSFTIPEVSIILGGGIRPQDVNILNKKGLNKFLIGTALHKGEISLNQPLEIYD